MVDTVGTRVRNGSGLSAAANNSRRSVNSVYLKDLIVTGTDISFTSPGTISSVGNAFGNFSAQSFIEIIGSPLNSRTYEVTAAAAGSLTVVPALITSEVAGATIQVVSS